jgi:hypothetical protein
MSLLYDLDQNKRVLLLRFSYWVGAIVDGFTVIPMLIPSVGKAFLNVKDFNPTVEYQYAMGIASSLMIGWTILLIWADRKPIERRGIVLITLIVMLGLFLSSLYVLVSGRILLSDLIPQWSMMSVVAILFVIGYAITRNIASSKD